MMRPALMIAVVLMGAPALAQDGTRADDSRFDAAQLRDALAGRLIEFHDDSEARYELDGRYSYRYRPVDPPFVGIWETTEDSAVCVTFENGSSRCDTIVMSASDRLTLIVAGGDRYPARAVRAIE